MDGGGAAVHAETITLKEGQDYTIKKYKISGSGRGMAVSGFDMSKSFSPTIPATCGDNGTSPCFTLFPAADSPLYGVIPFLQVIAANDDCKRGRSATMTVSFGGTDYTFSIEDDDEFAHLKCDGAMTEYHPGFTHSDGCRAHERSGADNACLAVCAAGQIYRDSSPYNPANPACETPPG